MKGLVIPIIVLIMMLIATVPLAIFDHKSKIGIGLRLGAGLVCLAAFTKFGAQFEAPGGKARASLALFAIAYLYVFALQCMKRKGMPLIETGLGCVVFLWAKESTQSTWLAFASGIASMYLLYALATKRYPVVSIRT